MNKLYFGDNLHILREHIKDETVDLIYLDPPFNSKKAYSAFFKTPKGHVSESQLTAFDDAWHWGPEAEIEFAEILRQPNTDVAEMIRALRSFLGENDMMAYLTMMANRLLELHRVLKPSGSLYLHCDPTASHYLKIILDGVFGIRQCENEIIWKRSSAHSDVEQGATNFGRIHDTIFLYTKSKGATWIPSYMPYDPDYIERIYRSKEPDGRRYQTQPLHAGRGGGDTSYEWKGQHPPPGRYWAFSKANMEKLDKENRIVYSRNGVPRYKIYLDESKGVPLQDIWSDITPVHNNPTERLGYPTQKPLALLERIIKASSNEGDVVLDPFCGCGTAVHAAQKLGRQWIGIDITCLAISLIENRLKEAFPKLGEFFEVLGTPTAIDEARDLALRDKYQFQWWACSLVGAQPYQGKKKGSDGGTDGLIYFQDEAKESKKIIVSVKGGESVGVTMVKDLIATVARDKAAIGLFVTLAEPTKPMITEAASAGFYDSPLGLSFPKIQILTIEGLLHHRERADYPDLSRGGVNFKRAQAEDVSGEQGKLL